MADAQRRTQVCLSLADVNAIHQRFLARWEMLHTHLHSVGYLLNPAYQSDHAAMGERELMTGFVAVLDKLLDEPLERVAAMNEMNAFRTNEGYWAKVTVQDSMDSMDPLTFWRIHGHAAPVLRKVALMVLSQPVSSSAAERNWSSYGFIHSKLRNRLTPARARDLVYVFTNRRLLNNMTRTADKRRQKERDSEDEEEERDDEDDEDFRA
jgi:hypothetical protein